MNYEHKKNTENRNTFPTMGNSSPKNEESALYEGYMSSESNIDCTHPVEITEQKTYSFRKLNSTDLFPMIKIISKIGINELTQVFDSSSLKDLIKNAKTDTEATVEGESKEEKSQFIVGIGIALVIANKILEHLPSCENEIYTLLSRVSDMKVEEIENLDIDVFLEMVVDFIMKEEFRGFLKVASKYIK